MDEQCRQKRPFLAPEFSIQFPFPMAWKLFWQRNVLKVPMHVHILHTDSTKCVIALFESTAFLLLAISDFFTVKQAF